MHISTYHTYLIGNFFKVCLFLSKPEALNMKKFETFPRLLNAVTLSFDAIDALYLAIAMFIAEIDQSLIR